MIHEGDSRSLPPRSLVVVPLVLLPDTFFSSPRLARSSPCVAVVRCGSASIGLVAGRRRGDTVWLCSLDWPLTGVTGTGGSGDSLNRFPRASSVPFQKGPRDRKVKIPGVQLEWENRMRRVKQEAS